MYPIDYKWIKKHPNKVDWNDVCMFGSLKLKWIENFEHFVNWNTVCTFQHLNENFIRKWYYRVNWDLIVIHQKLNDSFIDECHAIWNTDNWKNISRYQRLSSSFIDKYSTHLNWSELSLNPYLPSEIVVKYKNKIDWKMLILNVKVWKRFIKSDYNLLKCADEITIQCCTSSSNTSQLKKCFSRLIEINRKLIKIQNAWRICVSNPSFLICKKRLIREFNELNDLIH